MKGLSPAITSKLILSVGTHRAERPLSPVEVAEALQKALDAGAKSTELADALHLDGPTMIRRFTRLLALPSQIQPLIEWGASPSTLSFTTASELARLDTEHEQLTLAKAVLEHQFNKSEVQQVVQIRQRSGNSIEDSMKAVLRQRPVIERRHVIIGALRSAKLKEYLKGVPQLERNSLLSRVLEQYGPDVPSFGAKLGSKYFILVGDDHFHTTITSLDKGFEEAITEYLLLELGDGE